jgi:hypothetical protein
LSIIFKVKVNLRTESLKGRAHLEDLDIDGSIVLKETLKMAWEDANWISIQTVNSGALL